MIRIGLTILINLMILILLQLHRHTPIWKFKLLRILSSITDWDKSQRNGRSSVFIYNNLSVPKTVIVVIFHLNRTIYQSHLLNPAIVLSFPSPRYTLTTMKTPMEIEVLE